MNQRRRTAILVPCLLTLLVSGCGSDPKKNIEKQRLGNSEVLVTEGEQLSLSSGQAAGSGQLLFVDPLPSLASGSHFDLAFSLGDQGSLKLTSYSQKDFGRGLVLEFKRVGGELRVALTGMGETYDLSEAFVDMQVSQDPIKLGVDVHNNESPAHVLIWDRQKGKDLVGEALEEAALFNSAGGHSHAGEDEHGHPHDHDHHRHEDPRLFENLGNGSGTFWGLSLIDARVYSAQRLAPIFEE